MLASPRLRPLALLCALGALAVAAAQAPACHTYSSKGLLKPATERLHDVILVPDAVVVGDASISLTAQPLSTPAPLEGVGRTILLKAKGLGRLGNDMYQTTFSDRAPASFPPAASSAPFTGTFRPTQRFSFLLDGDSTTAGAGGSQGAWLLSVADVAPNATRRDIVLNGWTLVLCERTAAPAASPAPASPAPAVTAMSGPAADAILPPVFDQQHLPEVPSAITAMGGPTESSPAPQAVTLPPVAAAGGPAASSPAAQQQAQPQQQPPQAQPQQPVTIFGWKVINTAVNVTALPASTDAAAPTAPATPLPLPAFGSLKQQINAMLQQRFGAHSWRAVRRPQLHGREAATVARGHVAMFVKSAADAHSVVHEDVAAWLGKLQDWLPGDQPIMARIQQWMLDHKDEFQQLTDWIRSNGLNLHLPSLGDLASNPLVERVREAMDNMAQDAQQRRENAEQFMADLQGDNIKEAVQQIAELFSRM
eukprot:scaffold10.g2230.t1